MPPGLPRDRDPRLRIPGWWRDSSGLILPTRAPLGIEEPLRDLPADLRPQPAPVALEEHAPAPTDQFFAYIDEELLEVQPSTPAEVRALVRVLPAEPSLVILAKLTARVNQLGFRAREQLTLAQEFYGPGALLDRLRMLVRAEPSRRVFAEQQLLLLFWLIMCEAPDSDARELTPEQYRLLKGALVACSTVVGKQTRRLHESTEPGEWLGYFAQLSALYRQEMPLPPLARAQELFARSRDEIAQEDHQYCPLDQLHRDTYGLDVEEQLRLAFGLSALAQAFDQHRDAGRRVYLGPDVVEDFLVKAHLADRRDQALALISATRPQLATELGEEPHDSTRAIWDATPLSSRGIDRTVRRTDFTVTNSFGAITNFSFNYPSVTEAPFLYVVTDAAGTVTAQGPYTRVHGTFRINSGSANFEPVCLDGHHTLYSDPATGVIYCLSIETFDKAGWPAPPVPPYTPPTSEPAAPASPAAPSTQPTRPIAAPVSHAKYKMALGRLFNWAWSAVVDRFYGARGNTKLTALRVRSCRRLSNGHFRCNMSWQKRPYSFSGTVVMGDLNSKTGEFRFGFSLSRRNLGTGAKRRINVAY
jgi:hypothetical protein